VDISNSGAWLAGLQVQLETGEVLNEEYGGRRGPFRLLWTDSKGTAMEGNAGLQCLAAVRKFELDQGQLEAAEPLMRAQAVQRGLLTEEQPSLETLDHGGHCIQAKMIGGDYYDFLDMGAAEVGIILADIAGKGFPAALLMASLQGSLHGQCSDESNDLPQLLTSFLQAHRAGPLRHVLFRTVLRCHTHAPLRQLRTHNPPLLLRKGGGAEKLGATATVIGLFPDWKCSVTEAQLKTGDVLAIYTDGISETTRHNGEEFGERRLLETLRKSVNLEAAQIVRNVGNAVEQFRLGEQVGVDAGYCARSIGVADQVREPGHMRLPQLG
jgi:serine phosphatase RsbU (regulator of sigma subunit)